MLNSSHLAALTRVIGEIKQALPNLETLRLPALGSDSTTELMQPLMQAVAALPNLKTLQVAQVPNSLLLFDGPALQHLAGLERLQSIDTVRLHTPEDVQSLRAFKHLESAELHFPALNDGQVTALADVVRALPRERPLALHLKGNLGASLSGDAWAELARALPESVTGSIELWHRAEHSAAPASHGAAMLAAKFRGEVDHRGLSAQYFGPFHHLFAID